MNLDAVMAEVAARLDTITNLRVSDHPVEQVNPPHALVALPEITFDATYGRGSDTYALPVILVVGKFAARASRNALAPFVAGSGSKSFKQILEDDATPYTAFDALRVVSADFDVVTFAGVEYLAANFTLSIIGDGAA